MKQVDGVIVGGGPAGIAASIEMTRRGLSPVLIDENDMLGGKVLKEKEVLWAHPPNRFEYKIKKELFDQFNTISNKITIVKNAMVWGIFDGNIVAYSSVVNGKNISTELKAKKIIIATGAIERSVPFEGWTLPGIYTIGGLNSLVKEQRNFSGQKFLIAGAGPLLLVLANNLIKAGAEIEAIVDASSFLEVMLKSPSLVTCKGPLWIGFRYLRNIRRHKIPILRSRVVTSASGDNQLERVVITKVDKNWKAISGTEKEYSVNRLAVGYHLAPDTGLTRLCGCEHLYDKKYGYWYVKHDSNMATTVPGVFVAGDGASVLGYPAAIAQGRITGLAVSRELGVLEEEGWSEIQDLNRQLKKLEKFGSALRDLSAPRAGLFDSITDDTIICRCEEITFKDIKQAILSNNVTDVNHLKRITRSGMGHCQGRYCGQFIGKIISLLTKTESDPGVFTVRYPVKPIPLESLWDE